MFEVTRRKNKEGETTYRIEMDCDSYDILHDALIDATSKSDLHFEIRCALCEMGKKLDSVYAVFGGSNGTE